MPTYVYECAKCGEELEAWQSFADVPLTRHSGCGGKLTKVLQPVGIVLKGPGFYRTDNRNGKSNGSRSDKSDGAEKTGSSDKAADKPSGKSSDKPASKDTKPSTTSGAAT
jgi:putative FmdB family regulatory protein